MLSSSSSFLPTRISKEVGKDIITLVSQIGNIHLKKGGGNSEFIKRRFRNNSQFQGC